MLTREAGPMNGLIAEIQPVQSPGGTNEAQLNIISERMGHTLNRMLELGCRSYVHVA